MKRAVKVAAALLVLGGLGAGFVAWRRAQAGGEGLKLVTLELGSITEKAVAVGQIQPRQKFSVKSKISGIVKLCLVQVGDRIRAGDPLFEIAPDPTPQERTEASRGVESARASFERARAEYERIRSLETSGVVSRADLDQRREAFELAQIALRRATEGRDLVVTGKLEGAGKGTDSIIRAPSDGTLLTRAVNPGDPVVPLTSYQPGTELATVADMGDLIFKGTVDEIDVGKLREGLVARIKVGALPSDVVTGKVARIAPQAQQKDGATLFDVEIELEPGPDIVLRAGYSANADLIIREKKDVVLVPERLVTFEEGGKKAYVSLPAEGEGKEPRKVEIKLGISDGMNAEVVEGLRKGDRVIEAPPKEIKG